MNGNRGGSSRKKRDRRWIRDGHVIRDSQSGIEWHQFEVFAGVSPAQLGDRGRAFFDEGWRHATRSEYERLLRDFGFYSGRDVNPQRAMEFTRRFGCHMFSEGGFAAWNVWLATEGAFASFAQLTWTWNDDDPETRNVAPESQLLTSIGHELHTARPDFETDPDFGHLFVRSIAS